MEKANFPSFKLNLVLESSHRKMGSTASALQIILLLVYAFFCLLMLQITLQYIPLDTDVAFLRIKQDYVPSAYYRYAFFIHAYTAILALPAGFTQFFPSMLKKSPILHRLSGWIYTIAILLFAAPSGFIIGIHANGGWSSQVAFCLLSGLWFYFTWMAILKVKQKDFKSHKHFMYRSFALTLSAITLRAWKYVLVALFHPKPMDVYRTVAWLGWLLNLLIVEIIIYQMQKK